MRRVTWLVVLAVLATAAVVAGAFAATDYTVTSTATANRPGSKKKPARFVAAFEMKAVGRVPGERGDAPISFSYRWKGVRTNGADFPSCTRDQIDAAQSDSVCPKGSLIARAPFTAALGLEGDRSSILACYGKELRIYNNAPDGETWFMVGPPNDCNGIIYLAPFPGTIKTEGNTSTHKIKVPDNVCHPLPGLTCALGDLHYEPEVDNLTIKKGGRTIHYMTSARCKHQRKFTFIAEDIVTTTTLNENAGAC